MPYIGVSPQFGVRRKHTYTATGGQTSFSGAGSEGATLSYKDSNFVDVYQNGVKLGDADYTSTSGTAIVLAQGASVDDLVEIIVFDAFSAADTVSKADGGTFDDAVTMANTLDMNGTELILDADADTSITADTDDQIDFKCGGIDRVIIGADGSFTSQPASSGTIVFNEASNDVDFRIESNNDVNAVYVDAGNDRVGLFTSTPSTKLDVVGSQSVSALTLRSGDVNNSANGGKQIILGFNGSTSYSHAIRTRHNSGATSNNSMYFDVWQNSQSASDIGNRNVAIFDGDAITFPVQPSIQFQGNYSGNESVDYQDQFGSTDDGLTAFSTSAANKTHSRTGITYASATGRFTISTAGLYIVYFQAYYNDGTSDNVRVSIYKNGVRQSLFHHSGMTYGTTPVSANVECAANDYITFQHDNTNARNFYNGVEHLNGYITKIA